MLSYGELFLSRCFQTITGQHSQSFSKCLRRVDIVSNLLGHPAFCYLKSDKSFWLWTIDTILLLLKNRYSFLGSFCRYFFLHGMFKNVIFVKNVYSIITCKLKSTEEQVLFLILWPMNDLSTTTYKPGPNLDRLLNG